MYSCHLNSSISVCMCPAFSELVPCVQPYPGHIPFQRQKLRVRSNRLTSCALLAVCGKLTPAWNSLRQREQLALAPTYLPVPLASCSCWCGWETPLPSVDFFPMWLISLATQILTRGGEFFPASETNRFHTHLPLFLHRVSSLCLVEG